MVADHFARFGNEYAQAFLSVVPEPALSVAPVLGALVVSRRRRR
jgi:hypothetical protein